MKIGTKSVLFGAHCFFIHPWFVAWNWWKLFGFPWDPRLWVLFFVHDLGYVGKPNMDGPEGETHVEWGAWLMGLLFDRWKRNPDFLKRWNGKYYIRDTYWHDLSLYHSRFYAKQHGVQFSKLCLADKLAICEPWWLYLLRVNLSGEVKEYMKLAAAREKWGETKYATMQMDVSNQRRWFETMCNYLKKWVEEHKDMKPDTWTPDVKKAPNEQGVYQ